MAFQQKLQLRQEEAGHRESSSNRWQQREARTTLVRFTDPNFGIHSSQFSGVVSAQVSIDSAAGLHQNISQATRLEAIERHRGQAAEAERNGEPQQAALNQLRVRVQTVPR